MMEQAEYFTAEDLKGNIIYGYNKTISKTKTGLEIIKKHKHSHKRKSQE